MPTLKEINTGNKKEDGLLAIYFYRKVSLIFSWVFIKLNIHPNYITLLSFLFCIIGSYLVLNSFLLLGGVIWLMSFTLDCTDGIVARYTKKYSSFGKFFDIMLDRISFSIAIITLSYYFYGFDSVYIIISLFVFLLINSTYDQLMTNYQNNFGSIHGDKIDGTKESNFKNKLSRYIPFIEWKYVVLGVSGDLLWTWVFLSIFSKTLFTSGFILLNLMFISLTVFLMFKIHKTDV